MAESKQNDVKFMAVSRLSDKKVLMALNPHPDKTQFSAEFKRELDTIVRRTTAAMVQQGLRNNGNYNEETDSMQGKWVTQAHSQPSNLLFSALIDGGVDSAAANALMRQFLSAV